MKRLAILVAFLFMGMVFAPPVYAEVDTSTWGGVDKPEVTLYGFVENSFKELKEGKLDIEAIYVRATLGELYGLSPNAMFRSAEEWKNWADKNSRTDWEGIGHQFAVRQYELAIQKWEADNADGRHNRDISNAYVGIATAYENHTPNAYLYTPPLDPHEWDHLRYEALVAATDADPLNRDAWNGRIALLESRGLMQEAEEERQQRNQEVGTATVFFPLSLFPVIGGILILMLIAYSRRKNQ